MAIQLGFFGGVEEVTGSRHWVSNGVSQLLMDCGLFQGHRRESIDKNRKFLFSPKDLSAVLLSHAHIDHSGGLPFLGKSGFNKPIYCTAPTAELCKIMLMDSAHLQEEDAKFFNKIHAADGQQIEPLYTKDDVLKVLNLFQPKEYDEWFSVSEDIKACFINAGHVLGSAMIHLEMNTSKGKRRILFTGDLGRRRSLLINPPVHPKLIDYLLIESTYGGRLHDPIDKADEIFANVIRRSIAEKGRILIPSFALERTQEIVFLLGKLRRDNKIPPIHMYVDSPMATEITKVFNRFLDDSSFQPAFKDYVKTNDDPFGMDTVRYVESVEESKRLNDLPGAKIILSASGMCEGGRILHHLRNNIDKENTTVLIVGYQAEGTLGRRLMEGAKKVKIFGLQHEVKCRIEFMPQFSAHADANDLMAFMRDMTPRPRKIFLVHGDDQQQEALKSNLNNEGFDRVAIPKLGEVVNLE